MAIAYSYNPGLLGMIKSCTSVTRIKPVRHEEEREEEEKRDGACTVSQLRMDR